MKLIKTIFIILFFAVKLSAQNAVPVLEQSVSLNFEVVPVEIVLNSISQQTGAVFSFNSKQVDTKRLVSVHVSNVTIREALFNIFENSASIKEKGKYIILTKQKPEKEKNGKEKIVVEGYITNPGTDKKLEDVTIYDKGLMVSTVTDKYGYFKLELSPVKPITQLRVCKAGYTDTVISPVQIKSGFVNIKLPAKLENEFPELPDSLETIIPQWLLSQKIKINTLNISDSILKSFQISFLPFIGTNQLLGGNAVDDISINILGGYVKEVRKLEVGGIFNIDRGNVRECQVAGITNIVGGNADGVQVAGIFNIVKKFRGIQTAGIFNVVDGTCESCQLGGIFNISKQVKGIQAAGIFNISDGVYKSYQFAGIRNSSFGNVQGIQTGGIFSISKDLKGAQVNGILSAGKNVDGCQVSGIHSIADSVKGGQVSGIISIASDIIGTQVSGITNVTRKIKGAQIAGIINVADNADGTQIAGIINIADTMKGFQLSYINISDTCSGIPIGYISYSKKGYHNFELSFDELKFLNLSFRTGVPLLYNIFSSGMQVQGSNNKYYNLKYGIGSLLSLNDHLAGNIELSVITLVYKKMFSDYSNLYNVYLGINRKFYKHLSLNCGLTYNALLLDKISPNNYNNYKNIAPYYISTSALSNRIEIKSWVGARVAIRF